MPDADRRVPTAADVERWGDEWKVRGPYEVESTVCLRFRSRGGESWMIARALDGWEFTVGDSRYTFLGPVNPEPLTWPEGGR